MLSDSRVVCSATAGWCAQRQQGAGCAQRQQGGVRQQGSDSRVATASDSRVSRDVKVGTKELSVCIVVGVHFLSDVGS